MGYRDDLEAAADKADALERDNERLRDEAERLRGELAAAQATAGEKSAADQALAELAGRGQRDSEELARRRDREGQHAVTALAKDEERSFAAACSPFAMGFGGDLIYGTAAAMAGLASIVLLLEAGSSRRPVFAFAALILVAMIAVVLLGRRRFHAHFAARERRWLASLPFPVSGYEAAVVGNILRPTGLVVTLEFEGAAPDATTFRDLAAGLHPTGKSSCDEHTGRFELPPWRNPRRKFHRAVDQMLIPLGGRHPIARVLVELHPGFDP